jgi:hypothetical protein
MNPLWAQIFIIQYLSPSATRAISSEKRRTTFTSIFGCVDKPLDFCSSSTNIGINIVRVGTRILMEED